MYRFLEYDPNFELPSAADIYKNAVSLCGMSKSLSLPGLRIGWLTTQNKKIMNKLKKYRDYTTICSSAPSEILSIIGLKNRKKIVSENLKIIKSNLKLLDMFFKRHNTLFSWNKPQAGPVAFVELKSGQNVEDFCIQTVKNHGVMLLPASTFDFKGNFFRIGFGRKNMPSALKKFEKSLRDIN